MIFDNSVNIPIDYDELQNYPASFALFAPLREKSMQENEIAKIIVDCSFKVHTTLGPGLLESVYQAALAYELRKRGLKVITELPIPVIYEEVKLELGFRADLLVENKVIVETKSIEALAPIHGKVLLTYLRLADKKLGLLINFNVELIKNGIKRVVNNL
ncbi:MAG: GxxExxY protein [Pyrinomonadaceae bacterium]|nr:GxxExxY protein [Pyrinomonadaceae bacterium]